MLTNIKLVLVNAGIGALVAVTLILCAIMGAADLTMLGLL